mgnify:FL=1|jgi:hypothetical protein
MKKKYRLKKWVKVTLNILCTISVFIILALLVKKGVNDFEDLAKQCDKEYDYTCTYYDIRQYSLGK